MREKRIWPPLNHAAEVVDQKPWTRVLLGDLECKDLGVLAQPRDSFLKPLRARVGRPSIKTQGSDVEVARKETENVKRAEGNAAVRWVRQRLTEEQELGFGGAHGTLIGVAAGGYEAHIGAVEGI
jgi:hypothetical protein